MREDSYWSGFYLEAFVLRHFAHGMKQVLGKEERKSEMEGGGEEEMAFKSEFSSCEENATVFFLSLISTVGLQAANCGNSTAFQRWRYLRNALSGLRMLLISGGLDWLLSAERTQ